MKNPSEPYRVPAPGEAATPVRTPAELGRLAARRVAKEKAQRRKDAARARLANITGLAPNTVKASVARLVAAGWLERLRRGGPSGGIAVCRVKHAGKVGQ